MEDKGFMVGLTAIIGIIIVLATMLVSAQPVTYYNCYDIQYVEAPFGVLWVEIRGSFVFGCGSIRSNLKETYIVKYWAGNELHTIHLDAIKHPIIVDGSFKLEVVDKMSRTPLFGGIDIEPQNYKGVEWILHIPAIPPINQTVQWQTVG